MLVFRQIAVLNVYMRSDISLLRERIVRVICNFKYVRVGSFTGEREWLEKTAIFPESFCGRKSAKTPGKENSSKAFSYKK